MAMTNYLENKLIDFMFRGQSYTPPTTVYIALYTTATDDTGAGTEATGGSYARQAITCSLTEFYSTQADTNASTGTTGATSNVNAITYPTATADWGTATHMSIMDALTGGNMLFQGALTSSREILSGETAKFNAGELDVVFS